MVLATQPNLKWYCAYPEGQMISRQGFLHSLVNSLYSRTQIEFKQGTFRVKGDTVDINLLYVDYGFRVTFLVTKLRRSKA